MIIRIVSELPGGKFGAVMIVMLLMFFSGLRSRFYRNHFRHRSGCRPGFAFDGPRPDMARRYDRIEPSNIIFDTAVWVCAILFARCSTQESYNFADIQGASCRFIAIQLLMLGILALWPELATWLPQFFT